MSPFDSNSVVFHFDDFNYGRRSQPPVYNILFFSRSTVQKLENNMMNIVCQSCKQ
jgi:hypothetical protein